MSAEQLTMADTYSKNFSQARFVKFARQTLILNLTATVVAIGMTAGFSDLQTALAWRNVTISLIYSMCIGTLVSSTIMFGVAPTFGTSSPVRIAKLIVTIFITTLVGIVLANAIFAVIGMTTWAKVFSLSSGQFWFSLTIAFTFGFGGYFYELSQTHLALTRERLRQRELDAARSENLARAAQLASLESRLHPHFLFNTLNSIAALIREDADLAEKTVERLADLLRYSLDANANRLVDLQQELRVSVGYLEIERARFGARLRYEIDIADDFLSTQVPPFALQTLIENSIKHVAAKRPGALEIRIAARASGDQLEIEVADDGAGFNRRDLKEGHGLDTLQERCAQIFGDAAQLTIDEMIGHGRVLLRVPLVLENESTSHIAVAASARLSS